jgi:hypothetical protein
MKFTTRPFGCALRRARRISSLTIGVWRSLWITVFGTYQGASTIMRKAFDWKRSRISVLEVEAVKSVCEATNAVSVGKLLGAFWRVD